MGKSALKPDSTCTALDTVYLAGLQVPSVTDLTDLGLSSYEERAYRALLATGPAPARTVVDRSGVPAGRIYDVLDGLESRGLVRSQAGDPRQYAPVDPEEAIDRLVDRRLDELETEAERYRSLAEEARSTLAPTPPTRGHVWLSEFDDDDAVTVVGEILSSATDRFVMAIGAPYVGAAVEDYRREIAAFVDALPTEVTVDVLVDDELVDPLSAEVTAFSGSGDEVAIRQLPDVALTFEVVDDTRAYVDLVHPFADGRRVGFVEIREPRIANELATLFEDAWLQAEPVA